MKISCYEGNVLGGSAMLYPIAELMTSHVWVSTRGSGLFVN